MNTSGLSCIANAQLYFSGENIQVKSIYEIFRSICECLDGTMFRIFTPDCSRPDGELVSATDVEEIEAIISSAESIQIGMGKAAGDDYIKLAVQSALSTPGLEDFIREAPFIIFHFTSPCDITMDLIDKGIRIIETPDDANVFWGVQLDDSLENEAIVTIIALHSDKDSSQK